MNTNERELSRSNELRDEEIEHVVGGSSGVHIPLVTISVKEPPQRSTGSTADDFCLNGEMS
jgi:hypothetical protein